MTLQGGEVEHTGSEDDNDDKDDAEEEEVSKH